MVYLWGTETQQNKVTEDSFISLCYSNHIRSLGGLHAVKQNPCLRFACLPSSVKAIVSSALWSFQHKPRRIKHPNISLWMNEKLDSGYNSQRSSDLLTYPSIIGHTSSHDSLLMTPTGAWQPLWPNVSHGWKHMTSLTTCFIVFRSAASYVSLSYRLVIELKLFKWTALSPHGKKVPGPGCTLSFANWQLGLAPAPGPGASWRWQTNNSLRNWIIKSQRGKKKRLWMEAVSHCYLNKAPC